MKIQTIQRIQGQDLSPNIRPKEYNAGLCENNRGYNNSMIKGHRASSDVTFKGNYDKATRTFKNLGKTFFDKIAQSDGFEKLLGFFEEHTSVMQAGVALIVAGLFRPATNLAMSNKNDREDAMYAASHAVASGVIGFVVSSIILTPTVDKAYKKFKADPAKYITPELAEKFKNIYGLRKIGPRQIETSKAFQVASKMAHMMFDSLILGIPKALLTIALIPPILKYVFGLEKKSKSAVSKPVIDYSNKFVQNSAFNKMIKGGNK